MADLFGRERSVVTKHIRNAYPEGELAPGATSAKFAQARSEGGRAVPVVLGSLQMPELVSGYPAGATVKLAPTELISGELRVRDADRFVGRAA